MHLLVRAVTEGFYQLSGIKFADGELLLLVSLVISLLGALVFKHVVNPAPVSKQWKLFFCTAFGIWMFYCNWGWIIIIPLVEVVISHLIFKYVHIRIASGLVFILSMAALCVGHGMMLHKSYNNVMGKKSSADFTGTLMVLTQRITSYSCSLYDGLAAKDEDLSESRRKNAIRNRPTFVEYFSYVFNFFGILVGPLVFYNDFMEVFEREKDEQTTQTVTSQQDQQIDQERPRQGSKAPVARKFLQGLFMVAIFGFGSNACPCKANIDPDFVASNSLWFRAVYLHLSLFCQRAKYYLVWLIGDSIFNAGGIGFSGVDENGVEQWNETSNVNIAEVEFASGIKNYIDNWNMTTVKWIRLVSFDRIPKRHRTGASFLLSAFWHGFYPGYYIMFATFHLFRLIQQKWRRSMRPRFQTTAAQRYCYEAIMIVFTQLSISYSVLPFVTLHFSSAWTFYSNVYFVGHIIAVALLLLVPSKRSENPKSE